MTTPTNAAPPYAQIPAELGLSDADAAELKEAIWTELVRGHDDVDDFLDWATDDHDLPEQSLIAAFTALHAARLSQQRSFTPHRDRLQNAFDELNAGGVVARADFSCCGTCASGEIWDERDDSQHWHGYVYFHQQDTETLVESGETYVGYGAFPPADFDQQSYDALDEAQRESQYRHDVVKMLDELVFPVLDRHQITHDWNGSLDTRIRLGNIEWYVALPDPAADM